MGITVLLTIHGVGFQTDGYADNLHNALLANLPANTMDATPIYIEGTWPPLPSNAPDGLARLGTWASTGSRDLNPGPPLTGRKLVHIAIVYSFLEGSGPAPGSDLLTGGQVLWSGRQYATIKGLLDMAYTDAGGLIEGNAAAIAGIPGTIAGDIGNLIHGTKQPSTVTVQDKSTFSAVENDVAAYVSRNDLRERIRGFISEALYRLAYRPDGDDAVDKIILNTHSNGTVMGFDVLSRATPAAAAKVTTFVTAGSPLRKYADLFCWGNFIGSIADMSRPNTWMNFYDPADPVADPLQPPLSWRRGNPMPPPGNTSMFTAYDSNGIAVNVPVQDVRVNNVLHSPPGGLVAHNYWDNHLEFIPRLTSLIKAQLT